MNLQAEDKSNKALTVGSLNVLGGIKSDELTAIHTHLQTQDGVQSRITADMEKLYQSISADGVITANEKQMLKKELTIIETEYPIILAKAETAKKSKADIEKYKEAFQKLYHYIYSDLKVFDSMQTALDIERTTFNAIFAAYYSSRALLQITQDGTTKFLPSLEILGDYENQTGTFQGRLYRWTGGKWELLNAVMPLNPVVQYDMADLCSCERPLYTIATPIINKKEATIIHNVIVYTKNQAETYYHVHVESSSTGNAQPALILYRQDWAPQTYIIWVYCNGIQDFFVSIPQQNYDFGIGIWMHGDGSYQVQPNDSVSVYKFTVTEITGKQLIDSSGNGNHATVSGDVMQKGDDTVGTALTFNKGFITLNKQIMKYGHFESTGKYDALFLYDLSAYKGMAIKITISGYRKGDGGYPRLYIFDTAWSWQWHSDMQFDNPNETTLSDVITIPQTVTPVHCVLFHFPIEKMNNTIVMTRCTIELARQNPINYIGVGKQWTHSRWIKIDENAQDKTTNTRLWVYGQYDYAIMDIAANNGVVSDISLLCYKDAQNLHQFYVEKARIIDNQWHNLIVMTDLQKTYCWRSFYLDGKKIGEKRIEANFENFAGGKDFIEMPNVKGSLANLLFFDRLLTKQEALWLALNPQYPVKNYTLADWAIDPANPDSSIKNLTPKYLGVTETVPATRTVVITKGEKLGAQDAHAGDWVLMSKTVGGWKCGVCYRWTGSMWINLEPEYNYTEQYQAALYHICEIPELMQDTGHFGALFAKVLVAQQAFIDKLVAQEAFIKKLATEQAFLRQLVVQRLKIDSDDTTHQDFEAWFDETNGLKINNKEQEIFRIAPNGSILMGNNIFFKYLPYHSAGRLLCSESDTVKHFCETHGFDTFSVIGIHNGKSFSKIQTSKTEKYNMWFLGMLPKAIEPRPVFRLLSLKTVKYELTLYFNNGETYTIYYKNYPDMPEHTDDVYLYYNFEKKGYWSQDVNDVYIPQQVNNQLNFKAYIGVKEMNYVMTIENIPTYKPNGSGIVWKDGEFLKIS